MTGLSGLQHFVERGAALTVPVSIQPGKQGIQCSKQ